MRQPRHRPTCGNALGILVLLASTCILTISAGAQQGQPEKNPSSEETQPNGLRHEVIGSIAQSLRQAEQALEDQELQLAESLYREVLRDGWLLQGSLKAAAGDAKGAEDARQAASRSAAMIGKLPSASAAADLSADERADLEDLLNATLAQVYRNLGELCESSRREPQAVAHRAWAEALSLAGDDGGLARIDLRQSDAAQLLTPQTGVAAPDPVQDRERLAAAIAAVATTSLADDKAASQEVSRLHQQLARHHLVDGQDELAASELRAAVALGELDLDLGMKLADLEVAAGDAAAARRILQMVTNTHRSPRALLRLAELTWPTGPPETLPILLRARDLAPNSEEILGHTANAYLAADEPGKALEVLGLLMRLSPDVAPYVRLLAEAYTKLGRLEEATATLRQAIALEPSDLRSRIHLAGVLLHRKQLDEAEVALEEILAIDPERPEAKDLLEFLETVRNAPQPSEVEQIP